LKSITHAQKELMLRYFEVLEAQLRAALKEGKLAGTPPAEPAFIEALAARVHGSVAEIAGGIPDASAPSLQQVRKNLQNVLNPDSPGDARHDPIKALRSLLQQLRNQPEFTAPKGGVWNRTPAPRRSKP
jgi:hypothetical protein